MQYINPLLVILKEGLQHNPTPVTEGQLRGMHALIYQSYQELFKYAWDIA